jgi:hypothetical protein
MSGTTYEEFVWKLIQEHNLNTHNFESMVQTDLVETFHITVSLIRSKAGYIMGTGRFSQFYIFFYLATLQSVQKVDFFLLCNFTRFHVDVWPADETKIINSIQCSKSKPQFQLKSKVNLHRWCSIWKGIFYSMVHILMQENKVKIT